MQFLFKYLIFFFSLCSLSLSNFFFLHVFQYSASLQNFYGMLQLVCLFLHYFLIPKFLKTTLLCEYFKHMIFAFHFLNKLSNYTVSGQRLLENKTSIFF